MARRKVWVGMDVGAELTSVAVIGRDGEVVREQNCESNYADIRRALRGFGPSRIAAVAVEAGSVSMHLCRELSGAGYSVLILETRTTSKFLAYKRNKTDPNDARGLAEAALLGRNIVSEVRMKSIECQVLRSKIVLRHRIAQQRVSLQSALRSMFRLFGAPLRGGLRLSAEVSVALETLRQQQGMTSSRRCCRS